MKILRTRFKKEIVCEFLPPAFAQKRLRGNKFHRSVAKAIIFAGGMPGVPKAREVMEFWAKKGFWVFFPRYRGTWESGGEFLRRSPHEDIMDVIDELPKGFTDLWTRRHYTLNAKPARTIGDGIQSGGRCTLYVFGGSFGGPAAILCSRDPRVTKAVAFAPVIDWGAPSREEPMDKLGMFLPKGFGNTYRFLKRNWTRLSHNEFYSPLKEADTIEGKKLLIFHAKDDGSVLYSRTKAFASKTGAKLITLRTGGHFGFSKSTEPRIYRHIRKFIAT